MFKRLSVIAAVFFLLTALMNPALAGTIYDEAKAIDDAKQTYGDYYMDYSGYVPGQDQSLHYITDTSLSKIPDANGYGCGFLAYGQPHGDEKGGQYRYIGYTFYGEDYTNMDFPPDKYANGADFASQNWVAEPWNNPDVIASNPNIKKFDPAGLPGDGDSDIGYRYVLQYSILFTDYLGNNGYKVDLSSNPSFWDNIHLYVHVLSPATTYSWGIGRMWHYDASGNLWYVTVPIAPSILIPPAGNLKAVSIDLGVPPGQKAEPGKEYTATVVFENQTDQAYPGTPVAVLHGEYQAVLYDETGRVLPNKTVGGREVQVADFGKKGEPNARRTFTCKWHPFGQAKDGLTGIINRDEIGKAHLETTYEDNIISKETVVDFKDLSVQILEYTKEAYAGNPVTVKAKVFNSTGKMTVTKLVWKVNGSVVKEVPNFDIISEYDDAVTFDMPGSAAEVTVEVNPDRDAPPNEANWDNNTDSCSVKLLKEKSPDEDSQLKVSIDAPAYVDYWKNFTFRVTVSAYVPPPPPLSDFEPPAVSVTTNTSGGKLTWLYNYVDGSMENHSFEERFNDSFTAYGGRWTTETYTYTQRGCGIKGQEHDIIIEATAKMEGRTARDVKKVRVAAVPINPIELQLTQ